MRVCRPLMLNGIPDLTSRADLVRRSMLVHLPTIPADKRRGESALWAEFDGKAPGMLGAILSAVSMALRNLASVI